MRMRTLVMAVAMMAALLLAPMASSRAESPVFAGTKHTVLDTKGMQTVTAQGYTSQVYGYYGYLYAGYAASYGYVGYYYDYYSSPNTARSYYWAAYVYAAYAAAYFYGAYSYV